jgi:hypothetical protein
LAQVPANERNSDLEKQTGERRYNLGKNATGQNGHAQLRSIQTTSGIPFPDGDAINCLSVMIGIVSPSTSPWCTNTILLKHIRYQKYLCNAQLLASL